MSSPKEEADLLNYYNVQELRWQLGDAITLPALHLPWSKPQRPIIIYVKRWSLWHESARIRRHERHHVKQLLKYGALRYLALHVWARIKTRNIWGRGHWIEDDAYAAAEE